MNKATYFKTLDKEIKVLPKELQQQILIDYNELFQEGIAVGKKEEEVSCELGHPTELVNSYLRQQIGDSAQKKIILFDNIIGQIVLWTSLIIFIPINGWLFHKGYYGDVPKEIGNITKLFGRALIIDPFFMTATITALIVLIKKIKNNTERMVVLPEKHVLIERTFFTVIPVLLIIIYFVYNGPFKSLLIWLLVTPLIPAFLFKSSRKITERTINTTNHEKNN